MRPWALANTSGASRVTEGHEVLIATLTTIYIYMNDEIWESVANDWKSSQSVKITNQKFMTKFADFLKLPHNLINTSLMVKKLKTSQLSVHGIDRIKHKCRCRMHDRCKMVSELKSIHDQRKVYLHMVYIYKIKMWFQQGLVYLELINVSFFRIIFKILNSLKKRIDCTWNSFFEWN